MHHKIGTESGRAVAVGPSSCRISLRSGKSDGSVGDKSSTEGKSASSLRRLGATVGVQINCTITVALWLLLTVIHPKAWPSSATRCGDHGGALIHAILVVGVFAYTDELKRVRGFAGALEWNRGLSTDLCTPV